MSLLRKVLEIHNRQDEGIVCPNHKYLEEAQGGMARYLARRTSCRLLWSRQAWDGSRGKVALGDSIFPGPHSRVE